MKKFVLFLLACGLISCSSCAKKPVLNEVETGPTVDASLVDSGTASDVQDSSLTVGNDNWSFVLPSSDWEPQRNGVDPAVFLNEKEHNLVVFLKEEFPGTTQDYALFAVRGMKEAGATLVSSSQVKINGINFVLIESTKGSVRVFQWVAAKDKAGYGLSCGGLDENDHQKTLCVSIANTLNIK